MSIIKREMKQEIGNTEPHQQERPSAPLKCPRCGSQDTKFRYYNNNDRAQPRHYCKTCGRHWTVGGSLRDIPIGGSKRHDKQMQDVSPIYSNSISSLQPQSSTFEEWKHNFRYPRFMGSVIPQTFASTTFQSLGDLSEQIYPSNSYHFHDAMSSLAAIESLAKAPAMNESINIGNQLGSCNINGAGIREHNIQSMSLQIARHGDNLVHPSMPRTYLQDFNNTLSLTTSNASSGNNSNGSTNEPETARTPWTSPKCG